MHHAVRFPKESVYGLLRRDDELLMLWRHRVVPDVWGWEVPAGWVEPSESLEAAVKRETEEETGWRAGSGRLLLSYNALSGISNMRMHIFELSEPTFVAYPKNCDEGSAVRWIPCDSLLDLIADGSIVDGQSLLAVSLLLATRVNAGEDKKDELNG